MSAEAVSLPASTLLTSSLACLRGSWTVAPKPARRSALSQTATFSSALHPPLTEVTFRLLTSLPEMGETSRRQRIRTGVRADWVQRKLPEEQEKTTKGRGDDWCGTWSCVKTRLDDAQRWRLSRGHLVKQLSLVKEKWEIHENKSEINTHEFSKWSVLTLITIQLVTNDNEWRQRSTTALLSHFVLDRNCLHFQSERTKSQIILINFANVCFCVPKLWKKETN